MRISKVHIHKQFEKAKARGWLPYFYDAAQRSGEEAAVLMAIASRETNLENIIGDAGNGYGVMQVDRRSFGDWVNSGGWRDAHQSILKGAIVLAGKRDLLVKNAGKTVALVDSKYRHYTFRMPVLGGDDLTRAAIASYNCGLWAPYHLSKGRSVDYGTTDGDYSADVLARAAEFRRWLDATTDLAAPVAESGTTVIAESPADGPAEVTMEAEAELIKPSEAAVTQTGFLQASLGSAKRLWTTISAAGIGISQGLFDWAKGNLWLVYAIVGVLVLYIVVQAFLDYQRMKHAADPVKNNVH